MASRRPLGDVHPACGRGRHSPRSGRRAQSRRGRSRARRPGAVLPPAGGASGLRYLPRVADEKDPSVERGRRLTQAVGVSLIGSVVLFAVLTGTVGAPLAFQLGLLGLLVYQTLRGRGWARWLLVLLSGYAAFANGAAAVSGQQPLWLFAVLAAVYVACAGVLALAPPVRRFLEAQRPRS